MDALEAWVAEVSFEPFLPLLPRAFGMEAPTGRTKLIEWVTRYLPAISTGEDKTPLIKPLLDNLDDRTAEVRAVALTGLQALLEAGVPADAVEHELGRLNRATVSKLRPVVDRLKATAPVATSGQHSKAGPGPTGGAPPAAPAAPLAPTIHPSPSAMPPPPAASRPAPPPPRSDVPPPPPNPSRPAPSRAPTPAEPASPLVTSLPPSRNPQRNFPLAACMQNLLETLQSHGDAVAVSSAIDELHSLQQRDPEAFLPQVCGGRLKDTPCVAPPHSQPQRISPFKISYPSPTRKCAPLFRISPPPPSSSHSPLPLPSTLPSHSLPAPLCASAAACLLRRCVLPPREDLSASVP